MMRMPTDLRTRTLGDDAAGEFPMKDQYQQPITCTVTFTTNRGTHGPAHFAAGGITLRENDLGECWCAACFPPPLGAYTFHVYLEKDHPMFTDHHPLFIDRLMDSWWEFVEQRCGSRETIPVEQLGGLFATLIEGCESWLSPEEMGEVKRRASVLWDDIFAHAPIGHYSDELKARAGIGEENH